MTQTRHDAVDEVIVELQRRLAGQGLLGHTLDVIPVNGDEEELDLASDGPTVWVEQITASQPRQGAGRSLMAELCMLADEKETSIALNPWAQVLPDALRQDELERFYQSLGFGWRRDHIMVRRPWAQTVVNVRHDVPYLPIPNRIELVLSDTNPAVPLTKTSFVIPVMDDGAIVMAHNRCRGIEVPGGHLDPGETQRDAAEREGGEETGARLGELMPLGHLRMLSAGTAPPDWRYPHPLSYQQFFAARVVDMRPYVANDECLEPVIISDLSVLKPHLRLMARRARTLLGVKAA